MSDTYDRRCQLGASRRRLEDAEALHQCERWLGAIYMGGYVIECSLKALICDQECKDNFKDTLVFQKGLQGRSLHNLSELFHNIPGLQRAISLDRTGRYKSAWHTIVATWKNDELRYSNKQGSREASEKFIESVKTWHQELLRRQGETS